MRKWMLLVSLLPGEVQKSGLRVFAQPGGYCSFHDEILIFFKQNMEQLFSLKGWDIADWLLFPHCASYRWFTTETWLSSPCLFLVRVYRFPALKSWEGLDCLIQTSYSEVPCHVANLGHKLGFQSCFWALSLKFWFCIGPGVWVMSSKCEQCYLGKSNILPCLCLMVFPMVSRPSTDFLNSTLTYKNEC